MKFYVVVDGKAVSGYDDYKEASKEFDKYKRKSNTKDGDFEGKKIALMSGFENLKMFDPENDSVY